MRAFKLVAVAVLSHLSAIAAAAEDAPRDAVDVSGYAKVGYFFTERGEDDGLIGSRSGFRLANARVQLAVQLAPTVEVITSVEGSAPELTGLDPLEGRRVVWLEDAFIRYRPLAALHARAGQLKAPFNAERLIDDADTFFVSRSVMTDGLAPPEGFMRRGLGLGRHVGVELSSARLGRRLGLRYAAALVNGNGQNTLFNDNASVTPVGRLELDWEQAVTLGLNAYAGRDTEGVRPERLSKDRLGVGADVVARLGPVRVMAVALWRQTRHVTTGLPDERALGLLASAQYTHEPTRISAGLRATHFEPSSAEPFDRLLEVAAALGYTPRELPLRFVAQLTYRGEEPSVVVANNSVDLLVQATF